MCIIRDNDHIPSLDTHAQPVNARNHHIIAYRILKIYVCTAAQQLSRLVDFAVSAGVD
jgi:hypothetical protein